MKLNAFARSGRSLLATLLWSCSISVPAPTTHLPDRIGEVAKPGDELRLHMLDGTVYHLKRWTLDPTRSDTIEGTGSLYGLNRQPINEGQFLVPLESIALAEIDRGKTIRPFGLSFLATMSTIWGAFTVSCVVDPKSCFGSCPTFYMEDIDTDRPRAEGFSSSIARSLEAADLDDLRAVRSGGDTVTIIMRNEALETHAVRYVRLVAAPLENAVSVVATADGTFYSSADAVGPTRCASSDGSCLADLSHIDQLEFSPVTDSTDLAAREVIELTFANYDGANGIILQARQSFVSTYLIYQAMAYMGSEVGYWLASLERRDPVALAGYNGLLELTGSVDVYIQSAAGEWLYLSSFAERGPIASDIQAIAFPANATGDTVRVRLEMARGSWRIGYVALAALDPSVQALTLEPVSVHAVGEHPDAGHLLLDPETHLVTQPGDTYELVYVLPDTGAEYQLFLESKGYYYEWMRGEWIEEENPAMVALMLNQPAIALMTMAPDFKVLEASFEAKFWQSRFGGGQNED